jgi:hypothetical protein
MYIGYRICIEGTWHRFDLYRPMQRGEWPVFLPHTINQGGVSFRKDKLVCARARLCVRVCVCVRVTSALRRENPSGTVSLPPLSSSPASICVWVCVRVCVRACVWVWVWVRVRVGVGVCRIPLYMCVCVRVFVGAFLGACVFPLRLGLSAAFLPSPPLTSLSFASMLIVHAFACVRVCVCACVCETDGNDSRTHHRAQGKSARV